MENTEYAFYINEFHGKVIPSENEFDTAAVEANAYVRSLTRGKADELVPMPNGCKMAVCAVADIIYTESVKEKDGVIASESVGGHSVSYQNTVKSPAEIEREKCRKARLYLSGTGLLCHTLR